MKVNRKELLSALDAVMPGIAAANNEKISQSASFVFTKNRVFSYNDEVAVSHPFKLDIKSLAVPAKDFRGLVNKSKAETLELTLDEAGTLLLRVNKAKAGLRCEGVITLPLEELGMPSDWKALPEKFCDAIKFTLFSVCRDASKEVLTCLHIFDGFIESCDNYRITRYDMGEDVIIDETILLPASSAKEIIKYSPTEYAITAGWIHFRNDSDVIYSCRIYDDGYPDYAPFLQCEGDSVEFPAGLDDVLDRANVLSDEDRISLILEPGNIVVMSENGSGWFEEEIEAKYEGEPVEFDIQPEFMRRILKFKGCTVIGERVLRFDSDSFVHVVKLLTPKPK